MNIFTNSLEASLFLIDRYDDLCKMEDEQLPTDRYYRYIHKNLGNREFHSFPIMEIGSTGVYSAPYSEGRKTLASCGIGTVMFMPYEVDGKVYVASPVNILTPYFPNKTFLFSSEFFEEYRENNKIDADLDITEVAGMYMGRSHHSFCRYNGQAKYIFSREGVAVCPNGSDNLYMATELDASLKIDPDGPGRNLVDKQIDSYISNL